MRSHYNTYYRRSRIQEFLYQRRLDRLLSELTDAEFITATNLLSEIETAGQSAFYREMNDLTEIDYSDDDDFL